MDWISILYAMKSMQSSKFCGFSEPFGSLVQFHELCSSNLEYEDGLLFTAK